jgi:hypothetical protein
MEFKRLPGLQVFAWIEGVPGNDIVHSDFEPTGNLVQ